MSTTQHPPHPPLRPVPVPKQVPVAEGHVDVVGGRLWYWDTGGGGEPVVLSHPSSGSALSWPYQQPALAGAGHRVIAYSRRGHHGSTPADPDEPGTGTGDLRAVVEQLELGPIHLVGAAGGANATLDYAVTHPDDTLSLTVVSSYLGIGEPEYLALCDSFRPPRLAQIPHSFLELSAAYRATDPDGTREWSRLSGLSLSGTGVPRQPTSASITWAALETLRVRTLVMTGEADLYTPPALMRVVASHLPDARTIAFHTAGHSAPWERPGAFNEALLRFLERDDLPAESLW